MLIERQGNFLVVLQGGEVQIDSQELKLRILDDVTQPLQTGNQEFHKQM